MAEVEKWLLEAVDPAAKVPLRWLRERFGFLAQALRDGSFSRDAAIVPEAGVKSKLTSLEVAGGRDVRYVLVYCRGLSASWKPGFQERLVFGRHVAGTDLIYDLTGEFLQGKARPFVGDFRELPLRVYAVLPFQVERIDLAAQQRVAVEDLPEDRTARISHEVRIQFQDATGSAIRGRFPIYVALRRPEPRWERGSYAVTPAEGTAQPWRHVAQIPSLDGDWSLIVRSLLTGDELSLPMKLTAAADKSTFRLAPLSSDGVTVCRSPQPVKLDG